MVSVALRLSGLVLAVVVACAGCDLNPFPNPTPGGEAGAEAAGGNDPGGGLMNIGGNTETPPCGVTSVAGTFVSQKDFAAAGREHLDATHVADDGAVWLSLGYDTPFEIDGEMLDTPADRDVVVLRLDNGMATDFHRIHGTGDQHVEITLQEGALHVIGKVHDAAGGGAAELLVDDVRYDGFVDGDVFYLHIQGDLVDVYRLTGGSIEPTAVTIDELGYLWMVGNFSGALALSGDYDGRDLTTPILSVTGTSPTLNAFAARLSFGFDRLTAIGPPEGEGTAGDVIRLAGVVPFNEDGGEVVVFGDYTGRMQLGSNLEEAEGDSDLWLARIEPDGSLSDRTTYDAAGGAWASRFIVTPGGRGVLVGTWNGDLGWNEPPMGNMGLFVTQVKLRDLKRGRARFFSAPTADLVPTSLARYPFGNGIIIAGRMVGEAFPLLGDIMTNRDATDDGFVLALENDLDDRYAWHIEATGDATLRSVASAPCQAAAVVGSFEDGEVTARRLGSDDPAVSFSDAAQRDAFLLRLSY